MALAPERTRRLGRLERSAITGVLVREVVNFSSYWKSATFSSTVDPTIYLLAFGFGFGSLVSRVGGYDYVDFVGTGTVATGTGCRGGVGRELVRSSALAILARAFSSLTCRIDSPCPENRARPPNRSSVTTTSAHRRAI